MRQISQRLDSCLLAAAFLLGGALPAVSAPSAATPAKVAQLYAKLPLSFEANEGQMDRAVKFSSRGQGFRLFLTPGEAVMSFGGRHRETAVVRMQVAGGKKAARVMGLDPQTTRSSFFLGNDPSRWHIGVASYARVRYQGVYPGVDLIYRGDQRQLEYDFVVAPGADPRRIRLAFRGADAMTVGGEGELTLRTAAGDLVQRAPVVYQEAGDRRERVEGHYVVLSPPGGEGGGEARIRQAGFEIGRYDRTRPLIIDPVLVYSTFLGGSGSDAAEGIAVDAAGNAYVTGSTGSTTFPGVTGGSIQPAFDGIVNAFVTKINAAGTAIVYSTFLGGGGGDFARGIAVDAAGNVSVTGYTYSTTFPGVNSSSIQPANARSATGGASGFVTKIDAAGTAIVYSTFLGGGAGEACNGIAVDGAGNAYVTGSTTSTTFPGVDGSSIQPANGGFEDAFVTKINAAGTAIVYSTFLGGSGGDVGFGIAVDGAGNAYVTGTAGSASFPGVSGSSIQPTYGGGADAFVTKINAAGTAIVYSTFLGGSGEDFGSGIAVDSAGSAYVTGWTSSATFPGVTGGSIQPANGGFVNVFVTKINAAGTATVYSTFLGGSVEDFGRGIAVDRAGDALVAGSTSSATFPGVRGSSIQPTIGGGFDAFLAKISGSDCSETPTRMCLGNGRFAASATWGTADGRSGEGQVVRLTSDTGYLWFFSSSNVEAVVKVLDGCGLGGHYWVFAGGLTNVHVVLTVTDMLTGSSKTYTNPQHTRYQPVQDTKAFACP